MRVPSLAHRRKLDVRSASASALLPCSSLSVAPTIPAMPAVASNGSLLSASSSLSAAFGSADGFEASARASAASSRARARMPRLRRLQPSAHTSWPRAPGRTLLHGAVPDGAASGRAPVPARPRRAASEPARRHASRPRRAIPARDLASARCRRCPAAVPIVVAAGPAPSCHRCPASTRRSPRGNREGPLRTRRRPHLPGPRRPVRGCAQSARPDSRAPPRRSAWRPLGDALVPAPPAPGASRSARRRSPTRIVADTRRSARVPTPATPDH